LRFAGRFGTPDAALKARVHQALEEGSDRVSDLHLWRLAPGHFAVVAAIVSDAPKRRRSTSNGWRICPGCRT
jgi:Co/Zn/Cd efflux system component